MMVLGIDVGGTRTKHLTLDGDAFGDAGSRATPLPGTVDWLTWLVDTAAGLVADVESRGRTVGAVGIALPGGVDETRGIAIDSSTLDWRGLSVGEAVSGSLRRRVAVIHDVRAGCLTETRRGAARDLDRSPGGVLFVALGTGVAAAIAIEGRILTGFNHLAGEIGHITVPGADAACACGARGCLETIGSARAIGRRYADEAGLPEAVSADVVAEAVRASDEVAVRVWTRATTALGRVLAQSTALLDPRIIVLGGGLALAGPTLIDPVRSSLDAALAPGPVPEMVLAQHADFAGACGAALRARDGR